MTSIADYFRDIPGAKDMKVRQKVVHEKESAYFLTENASSKSKFQSKMKKTENIVAEFVASKNRQKFHRRDCEWAVYILNSKNVVTFFSYQDAAQAGYKPCRTCIHIREGTQVNA
jgi:hypothetical protein